MEILNNNFVRGAFWGSLGVILGRLIMRNDFNSEYDLKNGVFLGHLSSSFKLGVTGIAIGLGASLNNILQESPRTGLEADYLAGTDIGTTLALAAITLWERRTR